MEWLTEYIKQTYRTYICYIYLCIYKYIYRYNTYIHIYSICTYAYSCDIFS